MERFAGQWLGRFEDTNGGQVVLDLDQEDEFLDGMVYAFNDNPNAPNGCAHVRAIPEGDVLEFTVKPEALHPLEARFLLPDEIGEEFPKQIEVQLALKNNILSGRWKTDAETNGSVKLLSSVADTPSENGPDEGETHNWDSFQSEVSKLASDPYRYIFRGQSSPWRLRTSFHRTRRKNIHRFWYKDIPRLRHASTGMTDYTFDPNDADHNGAFMHLLQHHGYPTPMLDWTYSPYIAAFFAYSSASIDPKDTPPLRIFMFDAEQWKADCPQLVQATLCRPHFSLTEPLALGNPRALPQQSVATFTNVDDIEAYIGFMERDKSKRYLRVFDLDPAERNDVLRQLRLMGITHATMFPGIEGLCSEYRQRHFGYGP